MARWPLSCRVRIAYPVPAAAGAQVRDAYPTGLLMIYLEIGAVGAALACGAPPAEAFGTYRSMPPVGQRPR